METFSNNLTEGCNFLLLLHCEGSVRSVPADLEGTVLCSAARASGKAQVALLVLCESS